MELKKIDTILFKSLYLIVAGIVVTQVLGQESLTSRLFYLTFPITLFLWMRSVRRTVKGLDLLMLCTAMLAGVFVLLDASISNASLSFNYLKKVIMFIMTLLFLQTAHRMRVGQDMVRFIDHIVDFLTIFLIVMYFADNAGMHLINGRASAYLTFRFSNPNLAGLFITCMYMLEVYRLFTREKWYWKVIHITMAGMLALFVVETLSRNCLLVLIIFTAICAWLVFRGHRNLRVSKLWAILIAASPALFAAIYMLVIYVPWVQKLLEFATGVGKTLTSRLIIWDPALETLADSPLIGAYCQISGGTGVSQMHNTHIDIACSYGVIVLLLVCVLLSRYIYQNGRRYTDKSSYLYMLGFCCAILLGIGEAALFSGGMGIYVLVGSLLLLANREGSEA